MSTATKGKGGAEDGRLDRVSVCYYLLTPYQPTPEPHHNAAPCDLFDLIPLTKAAKPVQYFFNLLSFYSMFQEKIENKREVKSFTQIQTKNNNTKEFVLSSCFFF